MSTSFIPPEWGKSLAETIFPDVQTTMNLFGIHLRTVSTDWQYPIHDHPQYEINYVLQGQQLMTVGSQSYVQQEGDLMILSPGTSHSSRTIDGQSFTYFCIHFDIDDRLFLSLLERLNQVIFRQSSAVAQALRPHLIKIAQPINHTDEHIITRRMRLQAAVFELFGVLWEAISNEAAGLAPASYAHVEMAHQIAARLQGIANRNIAQLEATSDSHYGIDDIAAELGISPSHCNRIFHQVFAISPRSYLSNLVLHKSKLLLSDQRMSIQDIASILGYRDIAHFSRQFKRWSGISPSHYRKNQMVMPSECKA